mmetsp:Transcript_2685/g.8201  ORF Transcript_2685/g.8201 Transcript_2685/m.8201 type:complete len:106 (-) Transcript_2685:168-485(-)
MDMGESVLDAVQREFAEETRDGRRTYQIPRLEGLRRYVYHGHTAIIVAWTAGHVPQGPPPANPYARKQEILDRQWVPVESVRDGSVRLRSAAMKSMPAVLQELGL